MTDTNVGVSFGAQTGAFTDGVNSMVRPVASFTDRIKDLNSEMAKLSNPVANLATAAKNATNETTKLSFATSGATREFIVLGHEVMSGNFSRIPGSLLVLGERTGGLTSLIRDVTPATWAWAAAVAALVVVTYEWTASSVQAGQAQLDIKGALELSNQSLGYNRDAIRESRNSLSELADVSTETASKIQIAFARTGEPMKVQQEMLAVLPGYMAAVGKSAEDAAKDLIKMVKDPARGAEELARSYQQLVSASELNELQTRNTGATTEAYAADLLNLIGPKLTTFRQDHLEPLTKAWESLKNAILDFPTNVASSVASSEWAKMLGMGAYNKDANAQKQQTADAAEAQAKQNELNETSLKGLETLKTIHADNEKINELLAKRVALINAANAATTLGDSASAKRDLAGVETLNRQIQQEKTRMASAGVQAAKAAQREKEQSARESVSFEEQMGRLSVENARETLDQKVALGEITVKEEYAQLQKLADDEYALQRQALVQESQLDGLTLVEKQKVNDRLLLLHQKYLNQKQALTRKAALDERRQFDQVFQGIDRAFSTSINGILMGTQTWKQAMSGIFTGILSVFVDMAEKMASKWLETQLMNSIFGSEQAVTTIAGDAATAGAAAYASTAAIPVVGPSLAPAAAAQAYGATMAFQGLVPLETGAWEIPATGPALLHPGEMVVPRKFADDLRSNGGLGGGDVHLHVHAMDAGSVKKLFMENGAAIASAIKSQVRGFNPNIPAWKS
ncbi:MAG: phage tail length tape measure family protein [Planctomycetes bacterium]|nr:phage tail length tape measure family protein [Planctomycetota bacterium]